MGTGLNLIKEENFEGKAVNEILNSIFEKLDKNTLLILEKMGEVQAKIDCLRDELIDLRAETVILKQHQYNLVIDINLLNVRLEGAGLNIAYQYDYDEYQPYYFYPELWLPYEEYVKEGFGE